MSSGWTQSKIILGGFVDMLACKKCKKIPEMPMRYVNCGHFFCDVCIFSQNICFECHVPVRPREIKPYELLAKLLEYCNVVIDVITKNKSEDLKSLAKAVHQFSAEYNGVVPETDSDSEDEVVESTPPGGRSKGRNNREDENEEIESSEQSQGKERRREDAGSKVPPEPETKGFVSPTQFSPHQRKNVGAAESEEFLDGAASSPHLGGRNSQPETKGFVSPTQFSQYQKKMFLQAETKGFVSPSQSQSLQRKKIVEPETAGFVEPTQFSPHQGKTIEKPEIARFPDKPGCSSLREKKNLQGKTAGSVSPTRASQQRKEKKTQPETFGFVSPTQCSPRRKQKSAQSQKYTEPETAGFVDPTQFSPRQRKMNAEPETAGFVDPTQFSPRQRRKNLRADTKESGCATDRYKNHVERELEPETIGFCDKTLTPPGRKKMRLSIKTRKFTSRDSSVQNKNENATSESPRSDRPESADDSPRGNLEKICSRLNTAARHRGFSPKKQSRDGNATLIESAEFVDPTQLEKGGAGSLPPETEGYRDPSQSPVRSEMRKLAKNSRAPDSKLMDERAKNIEPQDKNSDSSDEMDWMEELVKVAKKLQGSKESCILAPETMDMEESVCRNSTIPESLENVENSTNYQNVPMEIEHDVIEKTILSKHSGAQNITSKSSNTDSTKRTISKVQDDSMEFLETAEESPVHQLKRIKSSGLSRRSRNSKFSQVFHSSAESEAGKKTSQEKSNIDENLVLDCCRNNSSIQDFDSLAVEQTLNERIDEMIEKTLTKRPRRIKGGGSSEEEQKKSPINSSISTEIPTNERASARKKTTKNSLTEKRRSAENRESESHELEKNAKSVETPGEPTCPRSREKLDKENLDATSKQNVKNKALEQKARKSVDRAKTPTPKPIPKNINKRNTKGETPLHTACVKGQKDYVKMLLEAGANPNTKDNANWTPLQEAVNLGHREICEMLLQAGASANTPAMENRTALHDAAANDKLEEAALLLRFKANRNVYDKFGKRPIDYAISEEMRVLLSGENKNEKTMKNDRSDDSILDQSIIIPNSKVVVLPSNLNTKNRKLLAQIASKLKIEVAMTFRSTVTHVVVETNDRNITELTYNVMLAILQGKWILNSQWITISSDLNDISEIDLELFEVHGAPNPETPTRARRNEENQNPRLFNNCYFYFAIGQRCTWSYEKFEFTKESLTTLVLGGQGEILHREPDPEVVKDYKLTPFHVAHKPIHPLYKCSHYIIYMPGKDEPRVKYNMPHIKSLPVGWFLECIEKFTLVDPVLMGIS